MENKHGESIEHAINDCGCNNFETARYLASSMHRYLQNEFFKIVIYFICFMAKSYENNRYDGRNEYACKMSKRIYDSFANDKDLKWTKTFFDREYEEYQRKFY